jgi:hypothetical protein
MTPMTLAATLPAPAVRRAAPARAPVLRRCACGGSGGPAGECEECRKKRLQRRASPSAAPSADQAPPAVHDVLRSPGKSLDPSTRAFMEPRFGHSFADVRVHADATAAESARAVGAHAYTVGRDVVFGPGRFAPGSADGRKLLAHELAHVVQQSASPATLSPSLEVGPVNAPEEREADAAAEAVAGGGGARVSAGPGGTALRRSMGGGGSCGGGTCGATDACNTPDQAGGSGAVTSGTMVVNIDIQRSSFYNALLNQEFGHTYVMLMDSAGARYTYGFYPASELPNEGRLSVPGCVHHPDTTHQACVDDTVMYSLNAAQFAAALARAQEVCRTSPNYHAQNYNCTTFAGDVVRAAGQSLPSMRGHETVFYQNVEADNPNTLIENVRAERERAPNDRFPFWNNPCFNRCEAQFNTCTASGPGGGTCIAQRQGCLRGCPPA